MIRRPPRATRTDTLCPYTALFRSSATGKGIEAEADAVPVDGLTLRGVLGYQDGKYNDYVTPIPAGYDLSSAPLDRLPKWQWTVDGSYEIPFGDHKVTLNGNVAYTARNLSTQSISTASDNTYLNARTDRKTVV